MCGWIGNGFHVHGQYCGRMRLRVSRRASPIHLLSSCRSWCAQFRAGIGTINDAEARRQLETNKYAATTTGANFTVLRISMSSFIAVTMKDYKVCVISVCVTKVINKGYICMRNKACRLLVQ